MEVEEAQKLWSGKPGWLNTASYGLPPRPAYEALQNALEQWREGSTGWETWSATTDEARASGLPPETAETAIDDLLAADVLRRGDNGLDFRHDLLRQAVERGIGWRARRAAHGKAADLRRRRGEPVDTWAAHVQGSASVGDLRAARWLTRAAAAVRPRSAELAADWYLAACA